MSDPPVPLQPVALSRRVFDVLFIPWVDKAIAVAASLPFAYRIYDRITSGDLDIPRATLVAQLLVLIGTMVVRRPPVRVTKNPLFWLLAFVATYWSFGVAAFSGAGHPVVSATVTNTLAVASIAVLLYARFSLGKNIGFVPAQRQLVTHGAYRFVRHPVYTGIFISQLALILRDYSPVNTLLVLLGTTWFILKSFVEESFLRMDPAYAEYMRTVRWRWCPGVA